MINKTLIIAHRGESYDAPENTLASINLAWERGAEAVEIDVHLSKDNKVVVIHDPNTKRVGAKNKKVKQQTLSELKELDVGSWKNEKYKDEKIPTLKEVLETIPSKKKLIIEIKSSNNILPFLKDDIKNSDLRTDQIEFISFSFSTVVETKKLFPRNNVLYLVDLDYTWYIRLISPSVKKLITKVKEANLDGLNVWAGKLLTKEFAQKIKSADLLLYTWTVNNPQHAQSLIDWGIDGITTDRAQWLKTKLE
ncbi:MAG: glycerophosphodiester phosphodiesterase [Ignavibacteriae bacterium]|nr:glycerophosphodiester phosphodiesterase [Ignavibacteriota bacterium]